MAVLTFFQCYRKYKFLVAEKGVMAAKKCEGLNLIGGAELFEDTSTCALCGAFLGHLISF